MLAGFLSSGAGAQDMPDPSLIHGRAIPAPELPNGTVTVRVVREAIGNNAPGQQVRVNVGARRIGDPFTVLIASGVKPAKPAASVRRSKDH